jgi:preprotein translocase subunit SecE
MAETKAPGASSASRRKPGRTPTPPPTSTAAKKKRTPPGQFFREVRAEGRKITWTSRKETWITSVMVFIMVALAVLFFWLVDLVLGFGVAQLIRIGA